MSRFVSNLGAVLAGGFLMVCTFAFGWRTTGWLALACGCALTVVVLIAFAFPGRGPLARWLDVLTLAASVWTLVASRVFGGPVNIKWLSFADGAAVFAFGLVGLLAHEVLLERELRTLAGGEHDAPVVSDEQSSIGDLRAA